VAFKFLTNVPVAELFLVSRGPDLVQRVIRPRSRLAVGRGGPIRLSTVAYQVGGRLTRHCASNPSHEVVRTSLVLACRGRVGRSRHTAARKVQDRFERQDDAFTGASRAYRRAAAAWCTSTDTVRKPCRTPPGARSCGDDSQPRRLMKLTHVVISHRVAG